MITDNMLDSENRSVGGFLNEYTSNGVIDVPLKFYVSEPYSILFPTTIYYYCYNHCSITSIVHTAIITVFPIARTTKQEAARPKGIPY